MHCRPRAHSSLPVTAGGGRARQAPLADERGAVLVVVILLIALMLSLGAAGTRSAQIELRIAHNDVQSKQALEVAEAGWNHAYGLIRRDDALTRLNGAADGFNDELSGGGTGGSLMALGSVRTLSDGNSYRFNHTSGQTDPDDGYYVRVVDNQDETTGLNDPATDSDNVIHIVSRGRVGTAERVIETVVQRDGTTACVVCGNIDFPILVPPLDVALTGAILTDSYDSRDGPYVAANARSNGHVFSNGDVALTGTPLLPVIVKGNVGAAGSIQKFPIPQNIAVTGAEIQNAPPAQFPPVLPCGPPYPPNTGVSGGIYHENTGILSDVGNADTITFAPGEYCFSAILMAGANSSLRVTGPTRISLTLPSTIVGVVNTTNIPANLRIESSVVSPLPILPGIVPALAIVGVAGNVSMVINAPQAIVSFAGVLTPHFYGQIIGGMVPNLLIGQLHYDESLANPRLYRRGWRELRDYPPA